MSQINTPKLLWLDSRAEDSKGHTFALNAVNNNEEEIGFIANELGNELKFSLPTLNNDIVDHAIVVSNSPYIQIGWIPYTKNEGVILSVREDEFRSEIGYLKNGVYSTLINSTELGFTLAKQIQGTLTIVNGCEKEINFVSPKLWKINIDSLDQYLRDGFTVATANGNGVGWDVSLMKLFFNYDRAIIGDITINNTGGFLPLGTYQIVANYLDTNLNEAGWIDTSLPIPIVDEASTETYDLIDGGNNEIFPPSNKSITVSFSEVDTSFSYLRIALIANNDSVRTAYKIIDYPITDDTLTYTITSITGGEITTIPLTDIAVSKTVYEEAKTITQTQDKLLIGNIKEKDLNFALFQQMANEITSHWFCKEITESSATPNPKSPEIYLDYRGYMSDEVYSIGVVCLFTDGYETPEFHIPARQANYGYNGDVLPANYEPNAWHNRALPIDGWDSTLLTIGTDVAIEDVKHIDSTLVAGDTIERWKVFNTAIRLTPSAGYYAEGELAYWESELDYPETLDCDGARVYPEGKVRYHKMPDVTLVPHALYDATENVFKTYPLGLRFENINYPTEYADQIIGYKIVRRLRDSNTSSVLDKGMLETTILVTSGDFYHQPYPYNNTRAGTLDIEQSIQGFHSPKTKFERNYLGASHLKVDQKLITAQFPAGEYVDYLSTGPIEYRSQARFTIGDQDTSLISPAYPDADAITNRVVQIQSFVDADTTLENVFANEFNNTEQQETFLFKTEDNFPLPATLPELIGSGEVNPVYFYYGAAKRYLPQQYGGVNSGAFIGVSSSYRTTTETDEYGGDTFISRLYWKKHARALGVNMVNDDVAPTYIESHLLSFYVESTINVGYRHEGTLETEVYYPKSYLTDLDAFLDLERTINGTIDSDLIPNYYAYNEDFSKENDVKLYFALPFDFDYCSDCYAEFKNRIAYSETKTNEGSGAEWRLFRANNYRDIPPGKGEITNLFIDNSNLYAHTTGSLYYIPVGFQESKTDTETIYVGTGAFLSLEPKPVKLTDGGYLGSDSQWATLTTEFGTIFHSYDKFFLLSEGLAEISDLGLSIFFSDNQIKFYKQFYDEVGIDYPFQDNIANSKGIGLMTCFDRAKDRLIITKRDFKALFSFVTYDETPGDYSVGDIVWNTVNSTFEKIINGISFGGDLTVTEVETIPFSNTTYFQNLSYTISFDVRQKGWISFHSYLPNFIFNTYDEWYSSVFTNDIYKHNEGEYQTFYGVKYPHIIEFPMLQAIMNSEVTNHIEFVSHLREFDSTYEIWKDVNDLTFNKVWIYNDKQSTGILDNVVVNNNPAYELDYHPGECFLLKADKTWRLNNHYNYVNAIPHSSKRWVDISAGYFIDKVPVNMDYSKPQYELERFRDGYINVRLIYDEEANYKLLTKYIQTNNIPSRR